MEGFEKAQREWERDNIYFPLDRYNDKFIDYIEDEDPEVDRRLEDE